MATEEVVVPVEAPVIEEKGEVSKMIKEAIVSLKERTGSSQYAITKFVEEHQKNLPANFKKVLSTQLKKLVAGAAKAAAVKSKAKPKTPTKPAKVAKKAPVAKAIAAKKTPVKKASVKSLKPKAATAKKVSAGRKAKK
uniref:Histone H1-like n=1 Tax=Tanacetum cinerariifolium TaxID=118510 RepID=A0A699HBK1_TANCI|nr:histone H1-like [Tanacetum cinerariifolium]